MSYILDALRKSEQQRQQGAAPLARLAQAAEPAAPARARSLSGLAAVLLIGAGIAIGWLRPWQAGPGLPAEAVASVPVAAPVTAVAPPPAAEMVPADPPAAPEVASTAPPAPPARPGDDTATAVASRSELPAAIRQELPALNISLHSHSANPQERMAMIDGVLLHEGEQLAPGLTLVEVTASGAILAYRGQRFSIGVRP
jgi:general secretion pathway protein B